MEKSWAVETHGATFYPIVAWTSGGPRLGAGTLLKRDGRREDDRLLSLLSVAHARDVPISALRHLVKAALKGGFLDAIGSKAPH